jgi:hypothetical protein
MWDIWAFPLRFYKRLKNNTLQSRLPTCLGDELGYLAWTKRAG